MAKLKIRLNRAFDVISLSIIVAILAYWVYHSSDHAQVKQLIKQAEMGNPTVQYELAERYYLGEDVARDYVQARYWFERVAPHHRDARYALGTMYLEGKGGEMNAEKALKWFESASEAGHIKAQYQTGLMYQYGQGTAVDEAKAFSWFQKASRAGLPDAQAKVGIFYYQGIGTKQDLDLAYSHFKQLADEGHPNAQYNLGVMYEKGEIPNKSADLMFAIYLWQQSAKQGFAPAQTRLGGAYYDGQGVAQDYQKAQQWFEKSAKQGDVNAQFMLGMIFKEGGHGVQQNLKRAKTWFSQACQQKDQEACQELALLEK